MKLASFKDPNGVRLCILLCLEKPPPCVYTKSSAAIISKWTPWQQLRMSTHIVKCGMRKKILRMGSKFEMSKSHRLRFEKKQSISGADALI